MSENFDVAIIGSGPGGYVAAIRAAQLKLKTVVIEKDKVGGVCLNIGCIPSKALVHQAEIFRSISGLEAMGIKVDRSQFDYSRVYSASRKAADTLSKGVNYLLKKNGVTVINGTAQLQSAQQLVIDGQQTISAKSIIIATGSRPRSIPGFEFDEKIILSSTGILSLQKLPERLLILGAGAIGAEFAHIMNAFGVQVHLVEMMERILPLEDEEVSNHLRRSFLKRGIKIYTSTKATSVNKSSNGAEVFLEDNSGSKHSLTVDQVLVVTGRVPNTDGIGLEKLGIQTERGFVLTGDYGETSVSGVYAIGDVTTTPLLAHVASKEGEIAVEHIAGVHTAAKLDLNTIPAGVYCEPQVGSFGLTEARAKKDGINYKAVSFPYKGIGKAVAVENSEGFIKLLFDPGTREILGAHAIGVEATELIHEILLAKSSELLPEDIADMIHAHPTLSEGVMEVARAAGGRAIHV
ncbi:MAG: dihydrolipoyl dehydrogenase [Fibrobacter sp.]|jgi:dihydrolipoamide dehydrogenase|nr:dihydrolipoyl dehydrogenase [Fibrobacter sp.]